MISYFDFIGDELVAVAQEHFVISRAAGYCDVSFTPDMMQQLNDKFGESLVQRYEKRDRAFRLKFNSNTNMITSNRYAFHGKEHQDLQRKYNYLVSGGQSELYSGR